MELPNDIIGYLCKFIKPKRYTLLNKFCRDAYFRKNGVSIELNIDYPDTDLYDKYPVKIIDRNILPDRALDQNSLYKRVTYIKCIDYHDVYTYKKIRKCFPRLEKMKCNISSGILSEITERALEGTTIFISRSTDTVEIERLISLGYKFEIEYPICQGHNRELIKNNISRIYNRYSHMTFNTLQYPNLKVVISHNSPSKEFTESLINHPTLEKIIYHCNIIPQNIVKKNGKLLTNMVGIWNAEVDSINDLPTYEGIKKYYNRISISSGVDMIMDYERQSKIPKKMTVILQVVGYEDADIDMVKKLLELFNVEIPIRGYEINNWTLCAKKYTAKMTIDGILFTFYIGNRKLRATCSDI